MTKPNQRADVARAERVKADDRRLTDRLLAFARRRFGDAWMETAISEYLEGARELSDAEMQLAVPWALFHYPTQEQDASVAEVARATRAAELTRAVREVLAAQLEAWLSIWEVREVEPGIGMTLHDILTKEERFVFEIAGSRSLRSRDNILVRVVDVGGAAFIAGLFPRALGPREADLVVREARRLCGVRTRPVDREHLRDPAVQLAIIALWRAIAAAPAAAPTLTNTDGDPFLLTADHFDIAPGAEREIVQRMASFPGAEEPEEAGGELSIVITRPGNATMKDWDNTIIGRMAIRGRRMRIETNSTRRADALRAAVAAHLGDLAKYRLRDEASVEQLLSERGASGASGASASPGGKRRRKASKPPELAAAERELRAEYMTAWLDQEIPALGGLTPRDAAKRASSRRKLELLLREFEHHDSSLPADERLDVKRLRKELGLDV